MYWLLHIALCHALTHSINMSANRQPRGLAHRVSRKQREVIHSSLGRTSLPPPGHRYADRRQNTPRIANPPPNQLFHRRRYLFVYLRARQLTQVDPDLPSLAVGVLLNSGMMDGACRCGRAGAAGRGLWGYGEGVEARVKRWRRLRGCHSRVVAVVNVV